MEAACAAKLMCVRALYHLSVSLVSFIVGSFIDPLDHHQEKAEQDPIPDQETEETKEN